MTDLISGKMTAYSSAATRWQTLRMAFGVIVTFCCAMPLVWLLSNLLVSGLRAFGH